ncbi:MAG: NAD(P)H-hydrate dehydratase [Luteolibacter sp.]
MSAVNVLGMRALEKKVMESGVSEEELMKTAGEALGRAIGLGFPKVKRAVGFLGKGHNAGDALIALRVLREEFGWRTGVRAAYAKEDCAELVRKNWSEVELGAGEFSKGERLLLLDGLLGIGGRGGLREPLRKLADEMKFLREEHGATVAAVDVPSGLNPDDGSAGEGAVVADRTFMIGAAKSGLLSGVAVNHVGALSLVGVKGLEGDGGDGLELICPQSMEFGKKPRVFDFHKGMAGRVGILAGCEAFGGAALISVLGALRAGGGLVTLHSPAADAVQGRLPFEAMLKPCNDARELLEEDYDALVIGPGIGDFSDGLGELICMAEAPTVVDADGLNFLAREGISPSSMHLLTPHPGEFERLAPGLAGNRREDAARGFVSGNGAVLLLKGGRTVVAADGRDLRINSTGTPAMANGGQGDLLSGVLGALLAGGLSRFDAAALGSWLCGRAAEISVREKGGAATATDTAAFIGEAMEDWGLGRR